MARLPEVIRRNPVSRVAADPGPAGQGWGALADLAQMGADFVKPAALEQAAEAGLNSVYRADDGTLKVEKKSVLGGELAEAHNSAAFAKYLAQRQIDITQHMTDLAQQYEFDPAGFKKASDAYIGIMREDETVPSTLKEDLLLSAQREAQSRFNGLFHSETQRTYREADRNTMTRRDMLSEDYTNLIVGGDFEAAEAVYAEIEELTRFRQNAEYISETPAEREAYLRGVRGAAKYARIAQRLAETSGEAVMPDDLKKEIDDAMEDDDFSPDMRSRLYNATNARLKGIDAAAAVSGLTSDAYAAKVVRAESGGVADAKNPNSSALGPHQFTKATWLESVREVRDQGGAEWAAGLSDEELLAKRKDEAASQEIFDHFRAKNAAVLKANGLPVTDTTEYMAHFFGAGGAVSVLSADPNTPLSDIVPAAVIEANPFLENMTAGDAKTWAARKMTMKASDIAAQQVYIDQIEDQEVRALATSALMDRFNVRSRLEKLAAAEYDDRISADDDTLTEQEILQDNNLADSAQDTLIAQLRKKRKAQIEVQETVAKLNDTTTQWDIYDSGQRKVVDGAYKAMIGDEAPMSADGQMTAGEIALRTGFIPQTMFNALRSATKSQDPATFASAMEFANQVLQRQPSAMTPYGGRTDVMNALSDYRFYSEFLGAEGAAARVIENGTEEARARRKNLSDAAKEASKGLTSGDVTEHLSAAGFDAKIGSEMQETAMMDDYRRLFTDAFLETGEVGLSKNRALDELTRVYGPSTVTGSDKIMKYPPQNFYPQFAHAPNWMTEQLANDVNDHEFGDGSGDTWSTRMARKLTGARWIPVRDISIMSDERTRQDVAAGHPPTYKVLYRNKDGDIVPLLGAGERYVFEPPTESPDYEARFNAARRLKLQEEEMMQQYDEVNRGDYKIRPFFQE